MKGCSSVVTGLVWKSMVWNRGNWFSNLVKG